MQKAIYLNALLHIEPEKTAVPGVPVPDYPEIIRNALNTFKRAWSEQSHLDFQIKRVRHEKPRPTAGLASNEPGRWVSLLLYLEGEQDAPQDFAKLTTAHLQKLLEQISAYLLSQGLRTQIEYIEENTNAVDELMDEEASSNSKNTSM